MRASGHVQKNTEQMFGDVFARVQKKFSKANSMSKKESE